MNDLKFAFRQLLKHPGFTAVAVLTLALGIGVNTAIFTLFNALALRPLPVKEPDRLVNVYRNMLDHPGVGNHLSYPEYAEYRDLNDVFSGLAAYVQTSIPLGQISGSEAAQAEQGSISGEEQLFALLVSGDYFGVLGGRCALGRLFLPEEDRTPGAHPVVVLSHQFWQRRFGSDPTLVGKTLTLYGRPFTVVGITAPAFIGTLPVVPDAWIPSMMQGQVMPVTDLLHNRNSYFMDAIGRLKPGVTLAQAQVAMGVIARQLAEAHPDSNRNASVLLEPIALLPLDVRKKLVPVAALVMAVVALVLLIACANVANLSLARAASRNREMGVRLALGATRKRIVRLLLTESALVALAGGLSGLLLASWLTPLLVILIHPPNVEALTFNFAPDVRIFGYTLGVSMATGIIVGLAPVTQMVRVDVTSALKDEGCTFGPRLSKSRLRNLLVIIQISVCFVLLIGAGLLVRGLQQAHATDPGFDLKHVLVVHEDLRVRGYDHVRAAEFYRSLRERLQTLPGVRAVSLAATVPLGNSLSYTSVNLEGDNIPPEKRNLVVGVNTISSGYFETLGIPLLRGRAVTDQETEAGSRLAVINEALANRLWPGEDPIGRRYRSSASSPWTEVVGLVPNTRNARLWDANQPSLYLPRSPLLQTNKANMEIFVRTERDPKPVIAGVRAAIQALDPNLRPRVDVLEQNLERWIAPARTGALLSTVLGLLALLLTTIGIYGVMACAVSQRTREIGVRMALGARQNDVLRLVLRQGLRLVRVGLALGLLGALALARVLSRFLFGLSPLDPIAFGGVTVFLIAVAMLACFLPARRAAQVDPMEALRYE